MKTKEEFHFVEACNGVVIKQGNQRDNIFTSMGKIHTSLSKARKACRKFEGILGSPFKI